MDKILEQLCTLENSAWERAKAGNMITTKAICERIYETAYKEYFKESNELELLKCEDRNSQIFNATNTLAIMKKEWHIRFLEDWLRDYEPAGELSQDIIKLAQGNL